VISRLSRKAHELGKENLQQACLDLHYVYVITP